MVYTNQKRDRSLAIAVNYKTADADNDFGPYEGASYLWLGGSGLDYFVIPNVAKGATIKMGVESHKITDKRGVQLYVGAGHEGEMLYGKDGSPVEVPTTYTVQEWVVPANASSTDIQVYNTNGCHIYFIAVSDIAGTEEQPTWFQPRMALLCSLPPQSSLTTPMTKESYGQAPMKALPL